MTITSPIWFAGALVLGVLGGPILALSADDGGRDAGSTAPAGSDAAIASADASAAGPAGARRRHRRRDGGVGFARIDAALPVPPLPLPPRPPPPPPPPPPPSVPAPASGTSDVFSGKEFNSCQKLPAGKRIAKLNLKPESDLVDLVAWISSITCKQFIMPASIAGGGKKITIVAPGLMTRDEAYRAFLNALESIGLTVVRTGKFLTIIETAKAKSASIPVYDFNGRNLDR